MSTTGTTGTVAGVGSARPGADVGSPRPVADVGSTRPVADRPPGALPLWREPAYVLLFVAAVFADMVSGNARQIGFPISPDRLLFGAALLLLALDPDAWRVVRLRWRTVHTLLAAMVALVVWSGLSVGTLTSSYGLYALVDRLLVPFVALALAPVVFGTERRRTLLARMLTVMGIYLGLTAFFEIIGPHALVFPRYIMNPDVGIQFGRARGPFVESEAEGLVLIVCGFAGGLLAARERGRWRLAGTAAALLCLLGVFLTETRSVWLGAIVGIVVVGLVVPQLRRWLPVAATGAAVAVVLALALSPSLRAVTSQRLGDQRSIYDRQNVNAAAIRVVEAKPLTGLGWVEFETQGSDYVRQAATYPITNVAIEVHNVFLGRAAELGVPGGALFAGCFLAGPGRAALGRRRRGWTGQLPDEDPDRWGWWLVSLGTTAGWLVAAVSSPLPYPLPNLLVWLVAGVALTPHLIEPRQPDVSAAARRS